MLVKSLLHNTPSVPILYILHTHLPIHVAMHIIIIIYIKLCTCHTSNPTGFSVEYRKTPPATSILDFYHATGIHDFYQIQRNQRKMFFCLLLTKRTSVTCFSESYDGRVKLSGVGQAVTLHARYSRPITRTFLVPLHRNQSGCTPLQCMTSSSTGQLRKTREI